MFDRSLQPPSQREAPVSITRAPPRSGCRRRVVPDDDGERKSLSRHGRELPCLRPAADDAAARGDAAMAARKAPGVLHRRRRGRTRPERVPRALREGRPSQPAVPSGHDGQGPAVRVRDWRVQLTQDRAQAARGRGISRAGRAQLSRAPNHPRFPCAAPEGHRRAVRAGRSPGSRDGPDQPTRPRRTSPNSIFLPRLHAGKIDSMPSPRPVRGSSNASATRTSRRDAATTTTGALEARTASPGEVATSWKP